MNRYKSPASCFLCIGAPKSGTTTLFDVLSQHPDIGVSSFKEPHFFDEDDNYEKGFEWYLQTYFAKSANQKIQAEFTPTYLSTAKACSRIFETFGNEVKLLTILRHPVERAYSHYLHRKRDGLETDSFHRAMAIDYEVVTDNDDASTKSHLIWPSLYGKHLERYLEIFERDNLRVYLFEDDFLLNRENMVKDICHFIGVEDYEFETDIKSNYAQASRAGLSWVKQFVNGESAIKNTLKKIMPTLWRQKIRVRLNTLVNKPTHKVDLDLVEKTELYEKYFSTDIDKLKKLMPGLEVSWGELN